MGGPWPRFGNRARVRHLVFGPLGLLPVTGDPAQRRGLLLIQQGALAAGAGLPMLLLYPMRGARRFTLVVGALNFGVCLAVDILSEARISS